MMFSELTKKLLVYIVQIEFTIFYYYKVDPYSLMSNMTVIDLQGFFDSIERQTKKEAENKRGDHLMKSLIAIRDILNVMTLPSK